MAKAKKQEGTEADEAAGESEGAARQLAVREVVEGVTAIVRKQGPIQIEAGQAVYKTENAYCIFDRAANRRIAWIPNKRVGRSKVRPCG